MGNMTKNRNLRVVISLMLIIATLFATVAIQTRPVEAASVQKSVSGSTAKGRVFTVITGKGWRPNQALVLTKSKGELSYINWLGKTKTMSQYGYFKVSVYNTKTGKTSTYNWYNQKLSIRLERNTKYEITVKPMDGRTYQQRKVYRGVMRGWKRYSYWSASTTANMTLWG